MQRVGFLVILSLMFFFAACERHNVSNVTVDSNFSIDTQIENVDDLIDRYKNYWAYFSAKEFEKSFKYELPYLNYIKPLSWYKEFHSANVKKFSVKLLDMQIEEGDSHIVYIRTRFHTKSDETVASDKWVLVDGEWYHFYSQTVLPQVPKPRLHQILNQAQ